MALALWLAGGAFASFSAYFATGLSDACFIAAVSLAIPSIVITIGRHCT